LERYDPMAEGWIACEAERRRFIGEMCLVRGMLEARWTLCLSRL